MIALTFKFHVNYQPGMNFIYENVHKYEKQQIVSYCNELFRVPSLSVRLKFGRLSVGEEVFFFMENTQTLT